MSHKNAMINTVIAHIPLTRGVIKGIASLDKRVPPALSTQKLIENKAQVHALNKSFV